MEESLREETVQYLARMLADNRSILEVIDSDWAMLNERLAEHYGIDGVAGSDFQRVSLAGEHQRGGVLTHAGILCATSTGRRTSPVWRGLFVRESLLSNPPPPPPANAGNIADKVPSEDVSVAQLMEQHRAKGTTCAKCHSGIDPWGLAFERYDGIGRFRTHMIRYDAKQNAKKGIEIEPRAELADGTPVEGMPGLKQVLLGPYQDEFLEASIARVLMFASGRRLTSAEQKEVAAIREQLAGTHYRFADLIIAVIDSEIFHRK